MTPLDVLSGPAGSVRPHHASFRDPAGFVFTSDGELFRQINPVGQADYDASWRQVYARSSCRPAIWCATKRSIRRCRPDGRASLVLRPERVAFVSYLYEWSFSQLKDAAPHAQAPEGCGRARTLSRTLPPTTLPTMKDGRAGLTRSRSSV